MLQVSDPPLFARSKSGSTLKKMNNLFKGVNIYRYPLSVHGLTVFTVSLSLAAGNMRQIQLSQAACCVILQDHRRLPVGIFRVIIAALGSLKRVTSDSIFKINKKFQRSKLLQL